ncbi:hypothetical protein [Phycicoccus duodecadis]|uniref:Glycerophosphoryl diester phosphodiesterase family protein n=1 Tax=Phycicoccus duodecadis TaxID=173053 RepID=A0A2N3YKA7_9MICO|nr:hypothetical protein [Phycicoccus duodecadis]PKW27287.1 hypothetical protein ATL31_2125 [Phycicoccus duodecadis]
MTDQPWVAPGAGPAAAPGPPPPPPAYPPPGHPAAAPPPPTGPVAYGRLDHRPGIIPLRPLTIGDLYSATLKAIRGNPGATIGLAALTTFAFLLPTTALGAWLAGRSSFSFLPDSSSAASDTLPDDLGLGILGAYLPAIGQTFSAILLAGFLAQVVAQAVLGRKVSMGQTWRATAGRVPAMVGAVLVTLVALVLVVAVTLGIPVGVVAYAESAGGGSIGLYVLLFAVGGLLLLAAGIYLGTAWAFATPSIVIERLGVFGGLARSARLVGSPLKGPFWRIFGLRLLTAVVVGFASSVVTVPLTIIVFIVLVATLGEDPQGSTFLVLNTVLAGVAGLITGALTTPFSAGVDSLLYVDARIRDEGLDVQLIQAAQGAAPAPWPTPSS